MSFGTTYNATSNYSVHQRYQADFQQGAPLQTTLSSGFSSVSSSSFGTQLGSFASSFSGLNMQPFSQASMMRGGIGFGGGIGGFAGLPNPAMEMAYQNRYQMGGAFGGGMTSFRGGVSSQTQGMQQLQLPAWMDPASLIAYHPAFQGNEAMAMVRSSNTDIARTVQEQQANLARQVAQMRAGGASDAQINNVISVAQQGLDGLVRQKKMNAISEMAQFIATMNDMSHGMAKGIISKISA